MKGEILLQALTCLEKSSYEITTFLDTVGGLMPRRNATTTEALNGRARKPKYAFQSDAPERARLYNLLSRLRKEGLIEEMSETKLVTLSYKGAKKLKDLRKSKSQYKPYDEYPIVKDGTTRIVSFDIPEHKRKERAWLRGALTHLKFAMRQQSYWIGTTKLPKQFITDLLDLKLLQYVDIVAVTKQGTLREIV